jgi:hypothetical protein
MKNSIIWRITFSGPHCVICQKTELCQTILISAFSTPPQDRTDFSDYYNAFVGYLVPIAIRISMAMCHCHLLRNISHFAIQNHSTFLSSNPVNYCIWQATVKLVHIYMYTPGCLHWGGGVRACVERTSARGLSYNVIPFFAGFPWTLVLLLGNHD